MTPEQELQKIARIADDPEGSILELNDDIEELDDRLNEKIDSLTNELGEEISDLNERIDEESKKDLNLSLDFAGGKLDSVKEAVLSLKDNGKEERHENICTYLDEIRNELSKEKGNEDVVSAINELRRVLKLDVDLKPLLEKLDKFDFSRYISSDKRVNVKLSKEQIKELKDALGKRGDTFIGSSRFSDERGIPYSASNPVPITGTITASIDTTGLATSTKQDTLITNQTNGSSKVQPVDSSNVNIDFATEATLESLAVPTGQTTSANSIPTVLSTEQESILQDIADNTASATGYEVVGLKNVSDDRINPATETTLLNLLYGSTFNNVVGEVQNTPTSYTVLDRLKALAGIMDILGEIQVNPTQYTVLDRLKTIASNQQTDALTDNQLRASEVPVSIASVPSHAVTNAGTFAVQNKYVLPLATNTTSTLTLTSASTAYQITEPGSDFLVTYCNMSDTDMYWGFATLTTGGTLLPKNGGTLVLKCVANNSPFFYCASAGKVLNYTTTLI